MENEFFLNAGIPAPAAMPIWPSAAMEIQVQAANEMINCSSEQSSDCFFNPNNWEKSTDHSLQFDSALSSMVSSPVASNSNISNESSVIRELIGKLGNIGNNSGAGEISPHSLAPYINNNNGNSSTNTSCYTTPLNSPPKLNLPMSLGNSIALNSSLAEFSADPGFAERAARFSRFGSRSFNGRSPGQFVPTHNPDELGLSRSNNNPNPMMANEKLPRVSSSPSLKVLGSQAQATGNKNSQDRSELANSQEESSVSEQVPNDFNSRKRKAVSKGKGKETAASPSVNNTTKVAEANASENSKNKRCKPNEGIAHGSGAVKAEDEGDDKQAKANVKANSAKPPEPPKDYIHVRARRGQATDSHSLAERVRREKISERMKLLQDLVPGCNKVTGKALMLDEIINYVQSLQRQVEFLSMKLASVNTRLELNVDALMSKDIYQPNKPLPYSIFPIDSSASAFFSHQPQQNAALHSNISNGTATQCPVDPLENALCRNLNMQLSQLEQFTETIPQFQNFGEDDLQSIVQMGFGQNPNSEISLQSQSFHGSNQASHMKIEL